MHRPVRTIIVAVAFCLITQIKSSTGQDVDPRDPQDTVAAKSPARMPNQLKLDSGGIATPVLIPGDDRKRAITSFELQAQEVSNKGGKARITFDESELSFNEFGDASVVRKGRRSSHDVALEAISIKDPLEEGRRLFALVFPDGGFKNRIYLTYSPGPITKSRLLIRGGTDPLSVPNVQADFPQMNLLEIIPLEDKDRAVAFDAEDPIRDLLNFHTPHFRSPSLPPGRSHGYLELTGTLGGEGALKHDLNSVSFTPWGDRGMSTLIGFGGTRIKITQRAVEDPLDGGRLVFDLVPQRKRPLPPGLKPSQYSLVISPKLGGTHRLIVRQGEKTRHVLQLYNPRRLQFLLKRRQLVRASKPEQQAVIELRRLGGDDFDFNVHDDQVTYARFWRESGSDKSLAYLNDLPHLKSLDFSNCRNISPAGFAPLESLQKLESLRLSYTMITDPVLAHVGNLPNLRSLTIEDEDWVAARDLSSVLHITDKGLASLTNLEKLEFLTLYGDGISDVGLLHLGKLTGLKKLSLKETRVTPAGLIGLGSVLPNTQLEVTGKRGKDRYRFTITPHISAASASGHVDNSMLQQFTLYDGLKALHLSELGTATEEGLQVVSQLPQLETLSLQNSPSITNEVLRSIGKLKELRDLNLWACRNVTDQGLVHLHGLSNLRKLRLGGTQVTPDGIAELRKHLPNCNVMKQ